MKKEEVYLEGSDSGFYLRTKEDILEDISDEEVEMSECDTKEERREQLLSVCLQEVYVDDKMYSKVVANGNIDVSDCYEKYM
jgi:hypothetical protein